MSRSRKLAATFAVLALTAVAPAGASASAAQEPPYPVGAVVECAKDTVHAYWMAINGYPMMYYCEI